MTTTRRTALLAPLAALPLALGTLVPADAATGRAHVTASSSDATPASARSSGSPAG